MSEDELVERINASLASMSKRDPTCNATDIAVALANNEAILHLDADGFVVLQIHPDRLHIWAAAAYDGSVPNLRSSFTAVKRIASLLECERITFKTTRKGWQRVAPRLGFKPIGEYEYEFAG